MADKDIGPIELFGVKIVNLTSYFLCRLILKTKRARVSVDQSLFHYDTPNQPLIMISNHTSIFDSWFICASIPFKTFLKIMPIRIMGATNFREPTARFLDKLGIVKLVYHLYGVVSFRREWTFEEKLAPLINCLKKSSTILIFPEGHVKKDEGVDPFKRGVVYVYKATKAKILPIAIRSARQEGERLSTRLGPINPIPPEILASEDPTNIFYTQTCNYLRQLVLKLYDKND